MNRCPILIFALLFFQKMAAQTPRLVEKLTRFLPDAEQPYDRKTSYFYAENGLESSEFYYQKDAVSNDFIEVLAVFRKKNAAADVESWASYQNGKLSAKSVFTKSSDQLYTKQVFEKNRHDHEQTNKYKCIQSALLNNYAGKMIINKVG